MIKRFLIFYKSNKAAQIKFNNNISPLHLLHIDKRPAEHVRQFANFKKIKLRG